MAESDGIFCHPFLPSVLIIEGVVWAMGWGGVGWGGVDGVGDGKNHCLGHPMSSHDAHTVANDTIVGPIVTGSKPRSHCPMGALHECHCSSRDSGGSAKCPSQKQTS